MILKIFLTGLITFLVVSLGILGYQSQLGPKSKSENFQTFVIPPGQTSSQIAQKLESEGLIKNDLAFNLYVRLKNLSNKIQAGSFKLSPHLSATEIASQLTKGTFDVWVTIPEGFRNEEIAERLNEKLGMDKEEFLKVAQEGRMFPDTYLIPKTATAEAVATLFKDNFDKKFTSELVNLAAKRGLSQQDVIKLASIVEREALFEDDRPIVAGILLKRLEIGMALEADATLQYALGYSAEEKSWWRKNLTEQDLRFNSAYNTRRHAGLPPGPICNPGLSAIQAVINPTQTDYLYYLSDKEGKMHYAVSLEEHIANINTYL